MQDKAHAQAQGRHAQTSAGHTRTRGPRKHRTCSQARGICHDKQAGKRANEGKVRAGRCKVRAHRKNMQCKHPGKVRVAVAVPWHNWPQEKCEPRQWWKMPLTSELLRAVKRASARLRESGKTVVCTYAVPLVAPSARRAPVPSGIAKLVIVLFVCLFVGINPENYTPPPMLGGK